jgi:O-Antigen ligase
VLVLAALRRTRAGGVAALVGVASLVAGVVLDRTVGAGRNAADRLASGAGGGRTTVWRYGLEAFADRPLFGYGFGEFRPAVQGRFSAEFVRDFAAEEITQPWFDPHNAVITVLVAVGVVGLALFLGWLIVWGRGVRGPLVWALVPIALSWMLQPMSLHTLPLAMLLFGAAGAGTVSSVSGVRRRTAVALAALGVVAGVYLLAADISLRRATNDLDGDRAASAASMYGRDPISGDLVAQTYGRSGATAAQLEWRERVAAWEPDRPHWWSLLAQTQIGLGLLDEAEVSVANALDLQRYNVRSINTEAILAIYRDDEERLRAALDDLCLVSPAECDLDAKQLLDEFEPATAP